MVYRPDDTDLSDAEIEALHELQLGREHLRRAHGELLAFHHEIGRGMEHYERAYELSGTRTAGAWPPTSSSRSVSASSTAGGRGRWSRTSKPGSSTGR